ncbi:glycosyltransferase [Pontiella sulfatireligans]|uniref:Mannosylfructose-phosphate synthase n=1 Tax=Pontiella sulfatireligans TaxID=2750658 RepID=A0A6C2UNX7_9BACT|nr:glycosyltransferase [Pontiella sulfatireligans]VGO21024.1 Mannosylfructose-phosphate synthase [Pontiella sulfatireligans]
MNQTRKYDIAIVGMMLSSQGGGMPRSMAQQAKIMTTAGHKVTLYIGDSKAMPYTPEQFYLHDSIAVHVSKSIGFWGLGLIPKTLWTLFRNAPQHDVIHLNGVWNFTTFFGAVISWLRKTPAIISCRSHYGDYHFTRMPVLKQLLFHTMEKINLWCVYGIHVTADWEEETSWRAANRAKHIIKIPNPVDLADFDNPPLRQDSRKHLRLDPNGYYVVHLGRTAKQKNLTVLIKSFNEAKLGLDAKLVLVGPPEPDEKEKLVQLAKELKIEDKIVYVDFAKGRERCHWLAAADLFALPSHDDNFCIVVIEAAASGTHCLTSPHVGAIEYLPTSLITVRPLVQQQWNEAIEYFYQNRPAQTVMNEEIANQFSAERLEEYWVQQYETMGF